MNNTLLREELDLGGLDSYFNLGKRRYVENLPDDEKDIVMGMYPDLDANSQAYLELITSYSYKQAVQRMAKYLNMSPEELIKQYPDYNSFAGMLGHGFANILLIEQNHKEELEELAVNTVLDLPEFYVIREMVDLGLLTIDAQLVGLGQIGGEENLEPPPKTEDATLEHAKLLINTDPEILAKRSFARTLMQGNAVNKFYLYHLVENALNDMDDELVKLYGIVCTGAHLGYYATPWIDPSSAAGGASQQGSAEVADSNTIVAKATFFPLLIHEIVKGIYNWLTYDIANQVELDQESYKQETLEIMSGEGLYKTFRSLISTEDQMYIPFIIKDLVRQPAVVIKTVAAGGAKAKQIMDQMVVTAKQTYEDWQNQL